MSFIQNLFTSRDNNANGNSYVGQEDRIWWNPDTNAFYYSNGNTAGGVPVSVANTANIVLNTATITGDLVVLGNITPAANNKIGGIAPGPGINISNIGLLTIDSANLPVSFGNFYANNNILSIVNQDQNMILNTQGNAEIQLVGNIGFYKTDGLPPNVANRYASFSDTGIVDIRVTATGNAGAVNIVGSTSGNEISPGQPGAMLHITGQLTVPTRLYFDGNANYVSIVNRRFNGNVATPTQVLAGEDVFRINATAATDAGMGNTAFAQIRATALENQTTAAQGSAMVFTVTPIGATASSRVDVANITTANGVSATLFTTSGTVSATGNITGGNVITAGLITATGNVTANNVIATTIVNAASYTGTVVSVTGNVTANNVIATTIVNAASYTGTVVSVTGNVTANNVIATTISNAASFTGGLVSVTGNVTSNIIIANTQIFSTGGVKTYVGNTAVTLNFNSDSMVFVQNPTNTLAFTLGTLVAGSQIKVIVAWATKRQINFGVNAAVNSTTAAVNLPAAATTNNQTVLLNYICIDGTAANTYVAVNYQ